MTTKKRLVIQRLATRRWIAKRSKASLEIHVKWILSAIRKKRLNKTQLYNQIRINNQTLTKVLQYLEDQGLIVSQPYVPKRGGARGTYFKAICRSDCGYADREVVE